MGGKFSWGEGRELWAGGHLSLGEFIAGKNLSPGPSPEERGDLFGKEPYLKFDPLEY